MAKHETTVVLKAKDESAAALKSAETNMAKTERQADMLAGTMSRILPALLAGVSIGSLVMFTQNLTAQQRELRGMAAAAGITAREIAVYGKATQTVGINTEQFADILKDVNDKLGEFVATGGGGFKDFFDVVPESVRPTAEELAKLSGPEVLVAVKDAMDAVNLSGKQQTFILESIGNDASRLIPLLENTGQAMQQLADGAERTVVVLDGLQQKNLEDLNKSVERAEGQFQQFLANVSSSASGVGQFFSTAFEYAFLQFNDSFFTPAEQKLKELQEEAATLQERLTVKRQSGGIAFALVDLEGQLADANAEIKALEDELGKTATVVSRELNPELAMAARHMARATKEAKQFNPELEMAFRHFQRSKIEKLADEMGRAVKQADAFGKALEFASKEQDKIKRAIKEIQGIQEQRGAKGRKASVLGALTASSEARQQLERGNTTRAAELALQAAEELRQVEQDTGKSVTNAEAFIKNFEQIAKAALEKSEKAQEQLKLQITVGTETKEFAFSKEGVKQAGDFTTDRVKEAARKAGRR